MVFGIYFYNIILESILTCWRYLKRGTTGIIIGDLSLTPASTCLSTPTNIK